MQGGFRKFLGRRPLLFVFGAQPLSQPLASVTFHRPIGFTDWPQAEVVGRTNHHLVEGLYYCLPVAKAPASPPRAEPFNWTSFANFSSARCLSGRFRASSWLRARHCWRSRMKV